MEEKAKVYMVAWAFLSEIWHADKGVTEQEILDAVATSTVLQATREQIGQRLYGGFPCGEGGTHFYHQTGQYTYTRPNSDLTEEERAVTWAELLRVNADQFEEMDRTAPFAADCPVSMPEPLPEEPEED